MRTKLAAIACVLMIALAGSIVLADQLLLKNGKIFSGKFVRADANVIEFRILGKIQSFKTSEVAQIIFQEPELVQPPTGRELSVPQIPEGTTDQRKTPPADRTLSSQPPPPAASTQPQALPSVTLPVGTAITIRTTHSIDTDRHGVGDSFDAVLENPLTLGSQEIAPRGADIRGVIGYAEKSGRLKGQTILILELKELMAGGRSYPLYTSDYSEVGVSQGKKTATTIGGGAVVGAVIGAIAGGKKGAAIGAATGAAVGTGVGILTKGETIKVPAETVLQFKLQHPLTIEVQ